VQLLMLTGQRLNDVAHAQRHEIDVDASMLAVPPERFKTGVAQEVPLTARAVEIVKAVPTFGEGYLFTTTGGARPISGISKMKVRLDRLIGDQRKVNGAKPMPAWVLHDLRRTLRTRLTSDLDVDAFTAERVLGHALPGLHGVYDQGAHRAQKRAALEKWEAKLLSIVEDKLAAATIGLKDVARQRTRARA
jgi:integrase